MYLNAFKAIMPNMDSGTNTNKVIHGFKSIKITKDTMAVNEPPTSCTNPVPIKLRTPSTSLIIT